MATEFSNHQFEDIYPEGIEKHYWNSSRNYLIKRLLKKNKIFQLPILEIGCGRGVVVNYLRKEGANCVGVELAEKSTPNVENYLHYGIDACELQQVIRENVRVILLLDVLEHIEASNAFLGRIKEAFPNADYFLITVPARQEIFSNYDEYNGHYLRYDNDRLSEDTAVLKSQELYSSYIYRLLYLPALLFRTFNIKRSTKIKAPKGYQLIIHGLLRIYFMLENSTRLFGFPGTSLVRLLKK